MILFHSFSLTPFDPYTEKPQANVFCIVLYESITFPTPLNLTASLSKNSIL